VILGILVGLVAFACNVFIPKIPKENDTDKRFVYGFAGLLVSTLIAGIALVIFWLRFEPDFVWFGMALCVAYITSLIVSAFQSVKQLKKHPGKQ
jgi:hypothetical protein